MVETFAGPRALTGFSSAVAGTLVDQHVRAAPGSPFEAQLSARQVAEIGLVEARFTPVRATRSGPRLAVADPRVVFLLVPLIARGRLQHRHGAEPVQPGHAIVIPSTESFEVVHEVSSHLVFVTLPEAGPGRRGWPHRVTSYPLDPVAELLADTLPALLAAAGRRGVPPDEHSREALLPQGGLTGAGRPHDRRRAPGALSHRSWAAPRCGALAAGTAHRPHPRRSDDRGRPGSVAPHAPSGLCRRRAELRRDPPQSPRPRGGASVA
ncbi:MAG TPA: hypothetical protein P5181_11545 [Dermatophilaceae bacterium]|nr:hypothetical protein [Dermatophilaceae bacterium]